MGHVSGILKNLNWQPKTINNKINYMSLLHSRLHEDLFFGYFFLEINDRG